MLIIRILRGMPGDIIDGVSLVESRAITPQGREERWLVSLVDPEVSNPVVEII